jgi:hypothetical protein
LSFGGNHSCASSEIPRLEHQYIIFFFKFDGIRRNFNKRSIYKNLFHVLSYIIYGVKACINKIKNDMNSFNGTKKGGGLNANIS